MSKGYVKLHRKTVDSGLMQSHKTFVLFAYLLMMATHKDIGYDGLELKRGQYVSGRNELASKLKLSPQEIRTALKKLEKMEILTIESTSKYSVYTIVNYDIYQSKEEQSNQVDNQQATSKQPASNQQATTKQEHKNINTEEELFSEVDASVMKQWLAVRRKKKGAELSEIVYKAMEREAKRAGITIEQAVIVCVERSWITFNAEWWSSSNKKSGQGFNNQKEGVVTNQQFNEWLESDE